MLTKLIRTLSNLFTPSAREQHVCIINGNMFFGDTHAEAFAYAIAWSNFAT